MPHQCHSPKPLHRRAWALSCAALLGGLSRLGETQATPSATSEMMTWPASLALLDAPSLNAEQLGASPTVLVFFSIDCPYCRRHNQRLSALALQTSSLRVLGAALDSDGDALRRYRDTQRLRFAITPGAQALREKVTARRVIPFTAVIAPSGRFLERIPGEMSESDILGLARWVTTGA